MNDLIYFLRAHVSPSTIVLAVVAMGGALIAWIGLTSVRRVSLAEEAARVHGVREPSLIEQWQVRLRQSGVEVSLWEFLAVGLALGAAIGAVFLLLGFITVGVACLAGGPVLYHRYLMGRRDKVLRAFREALPDAIDDCREYLSTFNNNLDRALRELAEKGPPPVRPDFEQVVALVVNRTPMQAALREVGQSRAEPFFGQFLDALAHFEARGGPIDQVLERIAKGQRNQLALQQQIESKQAGGRLVARVYFVAPAAFLIFMRLTSGPLAGDFYQTAPGQAVQLAALASGAATYWLTMRIARRGLYID